MTVTPLSDKRYSYIHDDQTGFCNAIDSHHIMVNQSKVKFSLLYLIIPLFLWNIFCLFLRKEKAGVLFYWSNFLAIIVIRSMYWNSIRKESVVIMPGLGVQLETHFGSGEVVRRFVPIGRILKPVLSECVTPVTCYWTLGLIVREEAELLLVFRKLRPPVKMLVPIWKALCAASDNNESMGSFMEDQ